jgi:dihydrofolate reductase
MSNARTEATRRVVAWTSVSIDGCTSGLDGPEHDTWLQEHAMREETAAYFEGIWRGCDTAVLGRRCYEGFYAVWPGITRDPATDPRTRDLGRWLDSVEKVVFSRTLDDAQWKNARIARDKSLESTPFSRAQTGALARASMSCPAPLRSTAQSSRPSWWWWVSRRPTRPARSRDTAAQTSGRSGRDNAVLCDIHAPELGSLLGARPRTTELGQIRLRLPLLVHVDPIGLERIGREHEVPAPRRRTRLLDHRPT